MPNIHHEVLIGAAIEKVYNAIVTQQGLSEWWTPEANAVPQVNGIARFPFGPTYHKEMKIIALHPPTQVQWTCVKGDDQWVGTKLSFELLSGDRKALSNSRPELSDQIQQQGNFDSGTLLIFHHDDWKDDSPMFAECSYTWGQFLRSLKLYCETGKGRPWPNQHRVS